MNRLGKILTLGLEKKRAWQLPIIAGLLVLFGLGVWWYFNWVAVRGIRLLDMVDIGDIEGVRWILKWDREQVNEEGEISEAYKGVKELHTEKFFPLLLAVKKDCIETAKTLLDAGAEVNVKDNHGWTILYMTAYMGRAEMAKLLVEAGANVNVKDWEHRTPLHWAAFEGRTELAKSLIQAGAEVNAEDMSGWLPLDMTKHRPLWINPKEHAKCAKLLRKHGGRYGAELRAEAKQE